MIHDEDYLKWLDRVGQPRPKHEEHGTEEDIAKNLQVTRPSNWRLIGNELTADTPMGTFSHLIPTDYIMSGLTDQGLPVLTKIKR